MAHRNGEETLKSSNNIVMTGHIYTPLNLIISHWVQKLFFPLAQTGTVWSSISLSDQALPCKQARR